MLVDGSGESAAAMAEQLAFEKLIWQRGAILDDEWLIPAQAVVMKRAGDESLPVPDSR